MLPEQPEGQKKWNLKSKVTNIKVLKYQYITFLDFWQNILKNEYFYKNVNFIPPKAVSE